MSTLKGPDERIAVEGFYEDVIPPSEEELKLMEQLPYEEEKIRKNLELKEFLCNATGNELKKRIYLEPMLSVCGLEAGELYQGPRGIVPHRAWARISFYLVANQNPVKIGRQLRNHLDSHGFEDVEVQMLGYSYPVKTSVNIPERNMLEKTARQVYKKPLVIEPTQLGAGPAIAIRRAWADMPVVGIGPGNSSGNHHAPDENLIMEDYLLSIKHMIAFLFEMGEENGNDGKTFGK